MSTAWVADSLKQVADVEKKARECGFKREADICQDLLTILLLYTETGTARSPRYSYKSSDFGGGISASIWRTIRDKQRPGAFMRFLGMPPFLFEKICEKARPFLAAHDPESPTYASTRGRIP